MEPSEPFYLVHFAAEASFEDIIWFLEKVVRSKAENGAELLVECVEPLENQGIIVLLSIAFERRVSVAGVLGFKKIDLWGNLREFVPQSRHEFINQHNQAQFFTSAEVLAMIRHEMNELRAVDHVILPDSKMHIYPGHNLVNRLIHGQVIVDFFPMHQPRELERLIHQCRGSKTVSAPAKTSEKIRSYFGEDVALYFAFLHFFTFDLLCPTLIGLVHAFFGYSFETNLVFGTFHLLWAFIFTHRWKRKSYELSNTWGTNVATGIHEEILASYHGQLVHDPVTNKLQPYYPPTKTYLKLCCVSVPIVFTCMLAAIWLAILSVQAEYWLVELISTGDLKWMPQGAESLITSIPYIIYAVVVFLLNIWYRKLARKLTEWENHRTESQYERHRTTKVILFQVVNSFFFFFYAAFYLQDMQLLKQQVTNLLVAYIILGQLSELADPYLQTLIGSLVYRSEPFVFSVNTDRLRTLQEMQFPILNHDDPRAKQADREVRMLKFDGTHEEYLELLLLYGIVLFSIVVTPLAPLLALTCNGLEYAVDFYKLTRFYRRPRVFRAGPIDAWKPALSVVTAVAVVTNCSLIFLNDVPHTENVFNTDTIICIVVALVLMLVQLMLSLLVPKISTRVKMEKTKKKAA